MKTSSSYALLVLCAALLSASSAFANITNPGAGANMPPAPPVTVNLGASPEMGSAHAGNGTISVIQAFPNEHASLRQMDGASMFWLGMLGLLGATLFATGTTLIAQSTQTVKTEAPKAAKTTRVAQMVTRAVRTPAAV